MQKAHDASKNSFWKNLPSVETPITKDELNRMEVSMDTIDDRVVNFDTTKANQSDLLQTVKTVSFNSTTGIFTFTLWNNTTITVDTDLEKVVTNFDYDDDPTSAHYQCLVLTLDSGEVKYIDMSALITQYEFTNTSTVAFTVGQDGKITANVVDGSITGAKLQPNYLADVTAQANAAAASASSAEDSAEDAEAWAVGQRNGQDVPPTDPTYNNSAKHWAEEAAAAVASSDGHQILDPSGTAMTQRKKLQFAGNVSVTDDSTNEKTVVTVDGMTIISYGSSWSDFINAYNANKIVYCRASSGSNPGSGSKTRLAFMAYVNNESSPTEVEFQYYRTVSNHTSTPGDQIFVYKLTSSNGGTWTVTTRNVYTVADEVYLDTTYTSSKWSGTNTQDVLDEIAEDWVYDDSHYRYYTSAVSCVTGDTTKTITDSNIHTTSIIDIYPQTASGKFPSVTQAVATEGQLVITFDALEEATDFRLHIVNLT